MEFLNKRIIIITGHYGSGKTNLAVNLAFNFAKNGENIRIADLDIVNPYFRTSDLKNELKKAGVDVIASEFASSNLDIPALPNRINTILDDRTIRVILDIGGDDAGAAALGRFSKTILDENNYENLYVINARRILTQTPENTVQILREIESAGHVPVTGIVNNTNLARETDASVVRESTSFANEVSRLAKLPLMFTSVKENIAGELSDIKNILPVKIYVDLPW
jgi:signal recognition particle GTPase